MEKILEKIKEFDKIIIHGHVRPDGDCIGSQYGLMYLIKETFLDKEVYVTGETSDYVSFLGRPSLVDDKLFEGALCICVDSPFEGRLSDNRISLAAYRLKIDHHFDGESYCEYEYVDYEAASCTQIITEFYLKFKDELVMTKECATALYTGLVTDSGRFRYDSVTEKTFVCAGELIKNGVDLTYVDNCLSIEKESALRLKGYCLDNFKITKNGFAYIKLTKEEIEKFNVGEEVASSLVTSISTIENCPVWGLILETSKDIRVRLRSRGPAVNDVASLFNGGGHKKASGARLNSWDEFDVLLEKVDELLENYNK